MKKKPLFAYLFFGKGATFAVTNFEIHLPKLGNSSAEAEALLAFEKEREREIEWRDREAKCLCP